jgi:hypothetical protein
MRIRLLVQAVRPQSVPVDNPDEKPSFAEPRRKEEAMNSVPIACSLDGHEARRRWNEWSDVMGGRLGAELTSQGLTVRFSTDRAGRERLVALVGAERQCCGFVEWELEDQGDEMSLTVRGNLEGVMALAESFEINA